MRPITGIRANTKAKKIPKIGNHPKSVERRIPRASKKKRGSGEPDSSLEARIRPTTMRTVDRRPPRSHPAFSVEIPRSVPRLAANPPISIVAACIMVSLRSLSAEMG
jgi:hypothetical protein